MESKPSSVTINLKDAIASNNDSQNSNDTSLSYIITKNKILDKENRELRESIKDVNTRLDEETDINDKNDSRINSMKAVTKNVVEAKKIAESIKEEYKNINDLYVNIHSKYKTQLDDNFIALFLTCLFYNVMLFVYALYYNTYVTFISFMLVSLYLSNKFIKLNKNNQLKMIDIDEKIRGRYNLITKLNRQLKELKATTDYLYEYIEDV